ncbi:hypothetical protein HDU88_003891 [Geranomyces variabilis]|nr:hypothetical protein HDU88_003891 [Geranomyces variabilis]
MHERNPFNDRPNFAELARQYEHLAPYLRPNWQGAPSIDFKDAQALRELTYALLWTGFGLRLEIPLDMLCPPVPNRLDYVLTIEDLLAESGIKSDAPVHGIDIGAGASCIYPLLACKRNEKWRMLGLDIEPRAIAYATANVAQNQLNSKITVCKNETDVILNKDLLDGFHKKRYDFTMCNPPFYESAEQIARSRAGKDAPPRAVCSGTRAEMVTEGGELGFIRRILAESARPEMRRRVRWFTSLVGRKEDLASLEDALRAVGGARWEIKSLRQGATVRWVIAWTFIGIYEVLSDNEEDVKPTGYFGAAVTMIPRKVIRPPPARKPRKPHVSGRPSAVATVTDQRPEEAGIAKAEAITGLGAGSLKSDGATLPSTGAPPAEPQPSHFERRSKKLKTDQPETSTPSRTPRPAAESHERDKPSSASASKMATDPPTQHSKKILKKERSNGTMPGVVALSQSLDVKAAPPSDAETPTGHRSKRPRADISSSSASTAMAAGGSLVKPPAQSVHAFEEPVAKKHKKNGAAEARPSLAQSKVESTAEQNNIEGPLILPGEAKDRSVMKAGRRKAAKTSAGAHGFSAAPPAASSVSEERAAATTKRKLATSLPDAMTNTSLPGGSIKLKKQRAVKLQDSARATEASNGASADQSDVAAPATKKKKTVSEMKKREQHKDLALELPAEVPNQRMNQAASAAQATLRQAAKKKLRQRLRNLLDRQRANAH